MAVEYAHDPAVGGDQDGFPFVAPGNNLASKLATTAKAVIADALNDVRHLRFDKRNPRQAILACSYATILELAQGCHVLFTNEQRTSLPILLRSLLEAYADFRANAADAEYYKNMNAGFVKEKLRLMKIAARNPDNAYLAELRGQIDVPAEIEKLQGELRALRREGRHPLNNQERFDAGKLAQEGQSVYWLLCLQSHNNLSALEDRHIEKHGDEFRVAMFRQEDLGDMARYLDLLIEIVIESTTRIQRGVATS